MPNVGYEVPKGGRQGGAGVAGNIGAVIMLATIMLLVDWVGDDCH